MRCCFILLQKRFIADFELHGRHFAVSLIAINARSNDRSKPDEQLTQLLL
jgi:hypothetical protein